MDWPIIYYIIQFFKIIFLGLVLYLMFYMKLGVIELYQMYFYNLIYSGNISESLLAATLFNIVLSIFIVFIVIEAILKLYILFFKNSSVKKNSKISHKTKKNTVSRNFLTIAGKVALIPAGKMAAVKAKAIMSPVTGKIIVS